MLRGLMRLEERIVLDAVAGDGDDGVEEAEGGRILVIDRNLSGAGALAEATRDNVVVVEYDSRSDTLATLFGKIRDAGEGLDAIHSIAFAGHGEAASVIVAMDGLLSLSELDGNPDLAAFWRDLAGMLSGDGRIDLFACDLYRGEEGRQLLDALEAMTGVNFTASDNQTGNPEYGGDWFMESDGIQVDGDYFDPEGLLAFDSLLTVTAGLVQDHPALLPVYAGSQLFGNQWQFDSYFGTHLVGPLSVRVHLQVWDGSQYVDIPYADLSSVFDKSAIEGVTMWVDYLVVGSEFTQRPLYGNYLQVTFNPDRYNSTSSSWTEADFIRAMTGLAKIVGNGSLPGFSEQDDPQYRMVVYFEESINDGQLAPFIVMLYNGDGSNQDQGGGQEQERGSEYNDGGESDGGVLGDIDEGGPTFDYDGDSDAEGDGQAEYSAYADADSFDDGWGAADSAGEFGALEEELLDFADLLAGFAEGGDAAELARVSVDLQEIQSGMSQLSRSIGAFLAGFNHVEKDVGEALEPVVTRLALAWQKELSFAQRVLFSAGETVREWIATPQEHRDGELGNRMATFSESLAEINARMTATLAGVDAASDIFAAADSDGAPALEPDAFFDEITGFIDDAYGRIRSEMERRDSVFFDLELLKLKQGEMAALEDGN